MMVLRSGLMDDGEKAYIQLDLAEKPLAHAIFSAPELEEVMLGLARARAQMKDPVTASLDVGSRVETVPYPAWIARQEGAEALLVLRHPGYGWLAFLMTQEAAAALSAALLPPPS